MCIAAMCLLQPLFCFFGGILNKSLSYVSLQCVCYSLCFASLGAYRIVNDSQLRGQWTFRALEPFMYDAGRLLCASSSSKLAENSIVDACYVHPSRS